MIAWTVIHDDTHSLNFGEVVIQQGFTANALSITLNTKEYDDNREILGWLHQISGGVIKRYPIFTGDEVLSLIVPITDSLKFFPTRYLSQFYDLRIAYTNIVNGNSNAGVSSSIPAIILGLPDRVTTLESIPLVSLTATNTAIGALQLSDTSQNAVIGTIQTNVSNLSLSVSNLINAIGAIASSAYTLLAANQALESAKKYLATVAGLVCTLPASPAIGDVISLSAGNFNLRINHGNASQAILNLSTLTTIGVSSGIILKPYADIDLMFIGSNLWKTTYRNRIINNWLNQTVAAQASQSVTLSTTSGTASFGTTLGSMRDGVKEPTQLLTNGYLADRNSLNLRIVATTPFLLDQLRIWNGQSNFALGSASGYFASSVTVYRGINASGANLGTFAIANQTGIEQIRNSTSDIASTDYFFAFTATQPAIGIMELEFHGRQSTGGEILAA